MIYQSKRARALRERLLLSMALVEHGEELMRASKALLADVEADDILLSNMRWVRKIIVRIEAIVDAPYSDEE